MLLTALTRTLGTDAVDLVDLSRASALLRFRTARDGIVVLARDPGAFLAFRLEAVRFWCEAGSVLRAARADVLASLESEVPGAVDRETLEERSASVLAHLDRVATHLPDEAGELRPMSSTTDTVVLHLWQAIRSSSTSPSPRASASVSGASRPTPTRSA